MFLDRVFHSFHQLETSRLILRRMRRADNAALFGILSDDKVTRYYDDESFTDTGQAVHQIEAWEQGFANQRCIRWGIVRKGEHEIIGTCGFYGFHTRHKRASIGYELARAAWRQGFMTEALAAIMDYGFHEIGLNRIDAVVIPANTASIKLLEKLGFSNEGILKEYENWGKKGFVDLSMLSMLKKTWNLKSS
ncbi:MAG: GNAT family N-acetyltransferase [Anaerolineaceae bacterium]|nr:GNAT family N-acetyltransferase [Anaerolineaceae bacterium]